MKRLTVIGLAFAAVMYGMSALDPLSAQAAFTLRLTSDGQSKTVVDGGAGDLYGEAGAITFIGSVGSFRLNVTTGLSNPTYPLNDQPYPMLDLNSVDVTSSPTGGTLTIELWDDFDGMSGSLAMINGAGGTFESSSVSFTSTIVPVAGSSVSSDTITLEGLADSGSTETWISDGLSAFTLKQVAVISAAGPTTVSFDFTSKVVPEPATVVLWSGLFLGMGVIGLIRRRSRAA